MSFARRWAYLGPCDIIANPSRVDILHIGPMNQEPQRHGEGWSGFFFYDTVHHEKADLLLLVNDSKIASSSTSSLDDPV